MKLPFNLSSNKKEKVLYKTNSKVSGKIVVKETEDGLELVIGGAIHTIQHSKKINYWKVSSEYANIGDEDKILVLGLGGGEIIRNITNVYKNLQVTAVEIDPKVIEIYKKYFNKSFGSSSSQKIKIIKADAYRHMLKNKKKYDVIFGDVYKQAVYPKDYLEDTYLRCVKKSLYPQGQYVSNRIFSISPKLNSEEYKNQLKLYFKEVYVKWVGDMEHQTSNYVFFASVPLKH